MVWHLRFVEVCISECVCAGEGVACTQASRDPDWSSPDWSAPDWSGSGSSEKDLPKHSRGPNACFVLGSSVIECALKILLLFQLISNCCL